MFKGLANLGALLRNAHQISGRLQQLSEDLKQRRTTGSSGGGMVEVEINGVFEVLRCRIDEQLLGQGDRELLEDLVVAAVNQAVVKAKALHAEVFREMTGDVELPGLEEMIGKLTGMVDTETLEEGPPDPDDQQQSA